MISLLFFCLNGKLQRNITGRDIKCHTLSAVEPKFGVGLQYRSAVIIVAWQKCGTVPSK